MNSYKRIIVLVLIAVAAMMFDATRNGRNDDSPNVRGSRPTHEKTVILRLAPLLMWA